MQGEQISGTMVRSHLDELRARLGDRRYAELLLQLGPADQDDLRLVTPLSWVSIATVERLYAVISAALDVKLEDLHVEIATKVVGRAITTIWKALLRLASDAALVGRSPVLFKKAYGQGRLEVLRSGAGHAELQILDWPDMSEFALRGFRVGLESTLVAAGRRSARGAATRTKDGALVTLDWSGS